MNRFFYLGRRLCECDNSFGFLQGSSKAGYLGETSIDFAEFAEATNAFIVSLPLDASDSGPLLHVSLFCFSCNSCDLVANGDGIILWGCFWLVYTSQKIKFLGIV